MNGKVCLITGATSGIGQVTALELARMGATVVLLVRNRQRGEAVQQSITAQTGNANVEVLVADFTALESVRAAAEQFLSRYQRLDVLVNNAGLYVSTRQLSADGCELTFAVNHLAPFLLTNLLLECMQASGAARIVNVSSGAHMAGSNKFNDLRAERGYNAFRAYADSKLANVLFTYELARRLEGQDVTANCLHPGAVRTNFGAGATGIFGVFFNLARPFMLSPEQGAQTSIYLASSPEVAGISGKYFSNCRAQTSSPNSYDHTAQSRLWSLSEQLCGTLVDTK
ncbi:MAG: SDR family oxidoreductase [Candidatus Viridilinea halotolerans]|uniref:SDR family oxidoreductase n=1 Tax=Candidatus Viridilinea halotolerans TaxID=2491704 RepID=A0A426TXJ6_9CHLR|nr:MAG: SDR family oxidoreductase [Candidatus Viridilinea halotolerans]